MAYAQNTTVAPERSQAEIAKLLLKYGANGFTYGWDGGYAQVAFRAHERVIRFTVPLPSINENRFHVTEAGRRRADPKGAHDAEIRRRWRSMVLVIKAKLEAVETGVTSFEDEFMAHIVLPGTGMTVAEMVRDRIQQAYDSGQPIDLMPGLPGGASGPLQLEAPVDAEVVG